MNLPSVWRHFLTLDIRSYSQLLTVSKRDHNDCDDDDFWLKIRLIRLRKAVNSLAGLFKCINA